MIRQHYTGSSRRAVNVIWNAAGRYDFDPPFLAFFPNGDADDYFNLVIGLAAKWLDLDRLNAFFEGLGLSNTAQEASAVLWLGIENCVFQKELPDRPILAQLRKERAEAFYVYSAGLSRQQMMLQSMKVFDQEQARWAGVLGKKAVLSPAAVRLSKELIFSGDLDTDGVIRKMTRICEERFRLRGGHGAEPSYRKIEVRGFADAFARRFMRRELRSTDLLILRKGRPAGTPDRTGAYIWQHGEGSGLHPRLLRALPVFGQGDAYSGKCALHRDRCCLQAVDCRRQRIQTWGRCCRSTRYKSFCDGSSGFRKTSGI